MHAQWVLRSLSSIEIRLIDAVASLSDAMLRECGQLPCLSVRLLKYVEGRKQKVPKHDFGHFWSSAEQHADDNAFDYSKVWIPMVLQWPLVYDYVEPLLS